MVAQDVSLPRNYLREFADHLRDAGGNPDVAEQLAVTRGAMSRDMARQAHTLWAEHIKPRVKARKAPAMTAEDTTEDTVGHEVSALMARLDGLYARHTDGDNSVYLSQRIKAQPRCFTATSGWSGVRDVALISVRGRFRSGERVG